MRVELVLDFVLIYVSPECTGQGNSEHNLTRLINNNEKDNKDKTSHLIPPEWL